MNVSRRTVYNRIRDGRLQTIRTRWWLAARARRVASQPRFPSTTVFQLAVGRRRQRPATRAAKESTAHGPLLPPNPRHAAVVLATVSSRSGSPPRCCSPSRPTPTRSPPSARGARVSQDLGQLLQTSGDFKPATVIVTASQAKVDALAARHGLTVQQRLARGAVLADAGVSPGGGGGGRGRRLRSRATTTCPAQMAVTNQATGADQVQAGFLGGRLRGLSGRALAWR